MKLFAVFLVSFALGVRGTIFNDITGLSDIVKGSASRLSENVLEAKVKLFANEIEEWAKTGYQSSILKDIIKILTLPTNLLRTDITEMTGGSSIGVCIICRALAHTAIRLRRNGTPNDVITRVMIKLCIHLNLTSKAACEGIVMTNAPILFYIVDSKRNLTSKDVCGVIFQYKSCSKPADEFVTWTVEMPADPPRLVYRNPTEETFNLVQISDIHYDPKYDADSTSTCEDPICCRIGSNETDNGGKSAGHWGDYNECDTPWHSVVDTFNQVKRQGADVIYFTGDIIHHGIWETTREMNTQSLLQVYAKMKEMFPRTPIYPILGNHEPHPFNGFAPSSVTNETFSTKWLYKLISDIWIGHGWLPESARSTIMRGGFYTVSPKPGFRIIALNNNVCYTYNWWILYQPEDPDEQLKWLSDTLLEAEKRGEFVHILAHVPAGAEDCLHAWSREFRKIINRFAHIITAQFNGHTHNDELRVFYDLEDRMKPINVAWNGGSITTYSNLNPNYKVYTVNSNYYTVEDMVTWIYNMTEANLSPGNPIWYPSYSFKEAYNLKNITLTSLDDWLHRMTTNETLGLQYYLNFVKYADPSLKSKCDTKCLEKQLCSIVTTDSADQSDCDRFANLVTKTRRRSLLRRLIPRL